MNVLFGAAVVFAAGVLYGFSCDVRRWWDEARNPVRLSDLLESERMETLRRQLDEIWLDEEDPRLVREIEAQARVWAEVADLEMVFALPAREPRNARS